MDKGPQLIRKLPWDQIDPTAHAELLSREWLVTNGLGGYATGTVAGVCTRRYHGLLVAALPNPLGRVLMLNHLAEELRLPDGSFVPLGSQECADGTLELHGAARLLEFRLEDGLPVWRFRASPYVLEKRLFMPHLQNTVFVRYRLLGPGGPDGPDSPDSGSRLRLKLRPAVHFRAHDAPVSLPLQHPYTLTAVEGRFELRAPGPLPPLRLQLTGARAAFTVEARRTPQILYRIEESRGYEARGELHSPGHFRVDLSATEDAILVASTEPWETLGALNAEEALAAEQSRRRRLVAVAHPAVQAGAGAELVLAADQFIITPEGRPEDRARAHAAGDEVRTVIAGYHWFTDWGRDTMISLEGLTLVTGRHLEAGYILRTFAHHVKDGLIPNMFPEGEREGLYHTADATLWFFHALDRYLAITGDRQTLVQLLPTLQSIVHHHLRGTRFGIALDPADGLLRQGAEGYQLTWMDAKVDGWVVTPRRGKAVEINALWYNALRLLEGWLREEGHGEAGALTEHAERCWRSFNQRFWDPAAGHLLDVVDAEGGGDDPACRPNQLLALSLRHPVLDRRHWEAVLDAVERHLLTPPGLRSLARHHPDYKPNYHGDLRTRDAAYHQGTVWSWLIGPFIDAWLKVHPNDRAGARRFLEGLITHLDEACIGSVSEVFDAEPPFVARGCIAQAWGVAELLRCLVLVKTPA